MEGVSGWVCLVVFLLQHNRDCLASEVGEQASCFERCDESYFPGQPCYCNEACMQYENCCYDYVQLCNPHLATNDSWVTHQGHTYKYTQQAAVTATQAREDCHSQGALLLSINGPEEFDFVQDEVLRGRTLSAFIGGTDVVNEGEWVWADGTAMALPLEGWNAWYTGEPDNDRGVEDCSVITNYKYWIFNKIVLPEYVWRDYSCESNGGNEIQGFLCEGSALCDTTPCENGGSCYYIGGESDIECVCDENFVGEFCQYQVSAGELWTMCGGTDLTGEDGLITSPLYPKNYPANVRCAWYIEGVEGRTISLSFQDVDIEPSKQCMLDHVTLYDGHQKNGSQVLFGPYCNGLVEEDADQVFSEEYTTSSNTAMVVFDTDADVNHRGFQLLYKQQKCGQGTGISGCGTKRVFTAICGEITIEEHLEDTCEWQITLLVGQRIKLSFTEFTLQDDGASCSVASLQVYEGESNQDSLSGSYCGRRAPFVVLSDTNRLYLRLTNSSLLIDGRMAIDYKIYDTEAMDVVSENTVVEGSLEAFSLEESEIQIKRSNETVYQWHLKVPYGSHIQLQWAISGQEEAQVKVFQGVTEDVHVYEMFYTGVFSDAESIDIPYFQAVLRVTCKPNNYPVFNGILKEKEWHPETSHCYRPYYFQNTNNRATENHEVTPEEPVMLAVVENFYLSENSHYQPGTYCKWTVQATEESNVLVDILDANIYPVTQNCDYDGLVIYDGPNSSYPIRGPLCGESSLEGLTLQTSHKQLLIVFYSDPGFTPRAGGKLRALFYKDPGNCKLDQMKAPSSITTESSCGIILSPNFPSLTSPGVWFWIYKGPEGHHFVLDVNYVRGPAVADPECQQSLKIIEISKDATQLRFFEKTLLTLCGETDLFIPPRPVRVPPNTKFGIELNTITNTIPNKWEFKISYSVQVMPEPQHYPVKEIWIHVLNTCPSDYIEWRGHCYRYYEWVRRHYQPEEYAWQQTWHRSLQKCEEQNATLVSIYDEEEAYFIKHQLAYAPWFWDPAGPYNHNHRVIFIGLNNIDGEYKWTTGVKLSYADWYRPGPQWDDAPVYPDSFVPDIVNLNLIQPTTDTGSLCTVMLVNSPFSSTKWVKIPCDYPLFRAGAICKMEASGAHTDSAAMEVSLTSASPYMGCSDGWFLLDGKCFKMISNYVKVKQDTEITVEPMTFEEAQGQCSTVAGEIDNNIDSTAEVTYDHYLKIWNHTEKYGNILVGVDELHQYCMIIQPHSDLVTGVIEYSPQTISCSEVHHFHVGNVLCQQPTQIKQQVCGDQEFQCQNQICVSVDAVCDNQNDCLDNSDEGEQCDCGETMFRCSNSRCISLTLRCDYHDNCGDLSDEENCIEDSCSEDQFQCTNGQCIGQGHVCDFKYDCFDGSDESMCDGQCEGFQCYSGTCLSKQLEKDGVSDCPGFLLEDEMETNSELPTAHDTLLASEMRNVTFTFGCGESGSHVNCRQDVLQCFDRSRACVYDTQVVDDYSNYRVQRTCRDGSHLRTLCGSVECPGMYHCPNSYCIPYRKVCDGSVDCPLGHDEVNCENYQCTGLLRCKSTGVCISHSEVCDGINHCEVYHEDEKYCDLIDPVCEHCTCTGLVANCQNSSTAYLPEYNSTTTRSLRALIITHKEDLILTVDSFTKLHWLNKLNISHNGLSSLPIFVFRDLSNLLGLDLSFNSLRGLAYDAFFGLVQLQKLDLTHNLLSALDRTSFGRLVNLQHLILEQNNHLNDVDTDSFTQLPALRTLNSDAFKFCCIADQVDVCTPEADAFSNCEDLMANSPLQISIWILGMFAAVGNLFVVIWRLITDKQKVSSLFIINLGCSDFLMGVYLLIIASVDVFYRGSYIVYADKWKSSALCQLAGVLAMLSSEMSIFMLSAITVDRVAAIVFPLKFGKIRTTHARAVVITGWTLCFVISIIPLARGSYFGEAFFGNTGVCLPLVVSSERQLGWEYSVFIFMVLNLLSFLVITVGYAAIFMTVKSSAKQHENSATATADEYALAKKLVVIVATDFLCWVPVILIGFAALGGALIPPQVSAWIAVFMLPLNSAMNPLLYTISSIDCKKKAKKVIGRTQSKKVLSSATKSSEVSSSSLDKNGVTA